MTKTYLGIDLGTSSVKVLLAEKGRILERASALYDEKTAAGWWEGVKKALRKLSGLCRADAVGLSSQVGTYIINQEEILHWNGPEGTQELQDLLQRFPQELFIAETGMAHPSLISYPLPRLLYAKKHFSPLREMIQPKDLLIRRLCGVPVSDPYSWRGLANAKTLRYSSRLLRETGLSEDILPKLLSPWSSAGKVTAEAAAETGLPSGISVYTGFNDFYAALLGMGVSKGGDWFDITGTSEHLGVVCPSLPARTDLIASPFLQGAVCYGVTASSGASLDFGRRTFPQEIGDPGKYIADAPVFLPYLNGERAPVFDPSAKGAFYGITGRCTPAHMAYSVLEGVAFSLYHIYGHLTDSISSAVVSGKIPAGTSAEITEKALPAAVSGDAFNANKNVRISGGASVNPLLTYLKAELLQKTFSVVSEAEASALGAVFAAMKGEGEIRDFHETEQLVSFTDEIHPDGRLFARLRERFQLYQALYPHLKDLH